MKAFDAIYPIDAECAAKAACCDEAPNMTGGNCLWTTAPQDGVASCDFGYFVNSGEARSLCDTAGGGGAPSDYSACCYQACYNSDGC